MACSAARVRHRKIWLYRHAESAVRRGVRIPLPTVLAALASAALHVAAGMCASTIQFAGSPGVPIRVTLLPARPLAVGAAAPAGRRVHERLADRGELGACAPRAYLN